MKHRPLVHSVFRKDIKAARAAIANGDDVDAVDEAGRTALMHAAVDGLDAMAEMLIDAGARVDAEDRGRSWTALHFAVQSGATGIAERLIDAAATVNHREKFGNTPLSHAVLREGGAGPLVDLLIRNGADKTIPNAAGTSPQKTAASMGATLP